jgi:hypothetical protein
MRLPARGAARCREVSASVFAPPVIAFSRQPGERRKMTGAVIAPSASRARANPWVIAAHPMWPSVHGDIMSRSCRRRGASREQSSVPSRCTPSPAKRLWLGLAREAFGPALARATATAARGAAARLRTPCEVRPANRRKGPSAGLRREIVAELNVIQGLPYAILRPELTDPGSTGAHVRREAAFGARSQF